MLAPYISRQSDLVPICAKRNSSTSTTSLLSMLRFGLLSTEVATSGSLSSAMMSCSCNEENKFYRGQRAAIMHYVHTPHATSQSPVSLTLTFSFELSISYRLPILGRATSGQCRVVRPGLRYRLIDKRCPTSAIRSSLPVAPDDRPSLPQGGYTNGLPPTWWT